jgi:hypothetical protein
MCITIEILIAYFQKHRTLCYGTTFGRFGRYKLQKIHGKASTHTSLSYNMKAAGQTVNTCEINCNLHPYFGYIRKKQRTFYLSTTRSYASISKITC